MAGPRTLIKLEQIENITSYDVEYDGPEANVGDMLNAIYGDYTSKQNTGDFLNEYDDFWKGIMNNQVAWMLPTSGATTFGNTLRVRGPITYIGNSVNNSVDAINFLTTATAGALAFQRGPALYIHGNRFKAYKRFSFTAITSVSRMFTGFSGSFFLASPTNVEPNTLINCIGVCKLSTSNNLHLIHNDGTGAATTYDLGVNFVATTGFVYDLMMERSGSTIRMCLQKTEVATGIRTVSDIYIATLDIPVTNIATFMYITNNTSASIVGLSDYGTLASIRL